MTLVHMGHDYTSIDCYLVSPKDKHGLFLASKCWGSSSVICTSVLVDHWYGKVADE